MQTRPYLRPLSEAAAERQATAALEFMDLDRPALTERVRELKKEHCALLLAHNYQRPEVQDVADFVGDSLELSRKAAEAPQSLIVFCGVHFMAETAAILSPDKTVLLPEPDAGCPLADCVTREQVRHWKAGHPDGVVVAYVNTSAEVKAEADSCCTSSNAVAVVRSIPEDREILFVPDLYLGGYVRYLTGRRIHLWLGECHVHAGFRAEDAQKLWEDHPEADLLLHPECGCVSQCLLSAAEGELPADRTHVLSTGAMVRHASTSPLSTHLIGTEVGLLHRLQGRNPEKTFLPLREDAICHTMKAITLEKIAVALRDGVHRIHVDSKVAERARQAIERMLAIS